MNINVRVRQFQRRQKRDIPEWAVLQRLEEAQVKALAERLNIEYTDRMGTLSAIHKAR